MADEQNEKNQQDGSFQLNRDVSSAQIPEAPQADNTAQIQFASPAYQNQPYSYGVPTTNPNSTQEKLKAFFKTPIGKIILFTFLFLGIAAMIMYSTNSVGLKGSYIDPVTGQTVEGDKPAAATPVIDSLTPTIAYNKGEYLPFSVSGSNFGGPQITFEVDGIEDQKLSFGYFDKAASSDTKLVGKLFVDKSAAAGPRDVTIKNSIGESTKVAALEIKANADAISPQSPSTAPVVNVIDPLSIKPGDSDKGITLTGTNLSFLSQNTKAITFDDALLTAAQYTDGFTDGKTGHIFLNADKKITEGKKKITITNDKKESVSFSISVESGSPGKPANIPPLAPTWTAPAPAAELSLVDLAKTEFTWTAGIDADNAPSKTPNYQFAIIKGELKDQSTIAKYFTDTAGENNNKNDFVWMIRWTDKLQQEEMQKLLGLTDCVNDVYICSKFIIPANVISLIKGGQKYTAIVQQSDGLTGSTYATTLFTTKESEECPTDQYFIKDSKNSGCKKIPSFKGAFTQTGFICGLYKTILDNKDNSYHLNADTKTSLKNNLDTQCTKKPDAVTNTCLTKMTYIPSGKTLCEPLKIITDPTLAKDVCDQYAAETSNKSLSADTGKQIATIMGAQCKPKICPTGKFLNGLLVPDNCVSVISFPTKLSEYEVTKSCNTLKSISDSVTALATYQIDQTTFDMIKKVSKSEDCAQKLPAAGTKGSPAAGDTKPSDTSDTTVICEAGYYFEGKDCKKLPTLTSASLSEIDTNCKLYSDLLSGKIDGKMEPSTKLQVKELAGNVLCEQATKYTADDDTSTAPPSPGSTKKSFASTVSSVDDTSTAPPSLGMSTKKTVVQEPKLQPTLQPVQSNVLDALKDAPPSLSYSPPQPKLPAAWTAPSAPAAPATYTPPSPKYYEPLPAAQTTNYQPAHPVAGSYIPRSTAKTGPEMWIYSFGLAFATIGARKFKKRNK